LNRLSKLNDYSVGYKTSDIGQKDYYLNQARRQDLAAGGPKTRWSGPKTKRGGPHFSNTVLDVCSNRGSKREMGGQRFQMGWPDNTAPPLATALTSILINRFSLHLGIVE